MAKESKRFAAMREKIDRTAQYAIDEGLALLKELSTAKFDDTIEIIEWPVVNAHHFTHFKQHLGPWPVHAFLDTTQNRIRFGLGNRCRLVAGPTNKSEDLGYLLHQMPGIVIHFHLH